MTPSRSKCVYLAVIGTVLLAFGTLLSVFWPTLYRHMMRKELSITPDSTSFEMWKDTSRIPFYMDIYFFNWTNPHEIRQPGKKPNFVQLGPYSFLEKRKKVNIIFHPENSTVSYDVRRTWHFVPERSNGSLNDNVTQLNVVALSAAHTIRYWTYFWQTGLSLMLAKINEIHVTKTVDEFLFAGYDDSLIKMGQLSQMVDVPPFDKFGWMYMRNGSVDLEGHYNIATGEDDLKNIGVIKNWNYGDKNKFYEPPCNEVEGSAGEFWAPERKKDRITLYSVDICRPLTYEYERKVSRMGIVGYRYAIGENTLSNGTRRRWNADERGNSLETSTTSGMRGDLYHVDNTTGDRSPGFNYLGDERESESEAANMAQCYCNGECSPSGVINVTACRYGAPAFVSLPHFHKADPYYRRAIDGMNPDDEKHGFHITLEPATGIPIEVGARLQINVLLHPMEFISLYKDVPKVYFPVFWFNQRVAITEDLASSLRLFLRLPSIGFYSSVGIALVGALIIFVAGILHLFQKRKNSVSNLKHLDIALHGRKSELVYLNTTEPNGDTDKARKNSKIYPTLLGNEKVNI